MKQLNTLDNGRGRARHVVALAAALTITACSAPSTAPVIPNETHDLLELELAGGTASFGTFPFETWGAEGPGKDVKLTDVNYNTTGGLTVAKSGLIFMAGESGAAIGSLRGDVTCNYVSFSPSANNPSLPQDSQELYRTQLVFVVSDEDGSGSVKDITVSLSNGQVLSYPTEFRLTESDYFPREGLCD